ncbi:zf-HC2 domain-containing protein [Nocardia sp. NPDC057440]|uniref:zf-HC2 domain-containing protein n=1 Tax=Nocardia sp. NPDC057440 TaxID=3346134 RepID=UPI0036729166
MTSTSTSRISLRGLLDGHRGHVPIDETGSAVGTAMGGETGCGDAAFVSADYSRADRTGGAAAYRHDLGVGAGNFGLPVDDNLDVECKVCRTALSARIDGERETVPAARVDEHLEQCIECCSWYVAAVETTRLLRRGSGYAPDLTAAIFAAADLDRPRPSLGSWMTAWFASWRTALTSSRTVWTRLLLGVLGGVQCGLAIGQVAGADFGMSHQHGSDLTRHLLNESTAWSLAIGIGFIYCALRPCATSGVLPVLGVLVATLTAFVIGDLNSGVVPLSRVLSHGVLVVALVLVVVVHRTRRPQTSPPSRTTSSPPTELVLPPGAQLGRRTGHLRSTRDPAA